MIDCIVCSEKYSVLCRLETNLMNHQPFYVASVHQSIQNNIYINNTQVKNMYKAILTLNWDSQTVKISLYATLFLHV